MYTYLQCTQMRLLYTHVQHLAFSHLTYVGDFPASAGATGFIRAAQG